MRFAEFLVDRLISSPFTGAVRRGGGSNISSCVIFLYARQLVTPSVQFTRKLLMGVIKISEFLNIMSL